MLEITRGQRTRPVRLVIYGAEGVGKSTFASQADGSVFFDLENGTDQMDVARFPKAETWEGLLSMLGEVAKMPTLCKTVIVDTADKAEIMCIDYILNKYKKSGIEEFGYGKGYTYLAEEYGRLLEALDAVIAAGVNVIVTAHAKMRKFEQPDEMGAYDRWEMKLSKQVAPLVKEWCDALLFVNYKTYVVTTESNAKKAQGGKRVMYATHHPCWDAKNRHGLPDEMDLDFDLVRHIFGEGAKPKTLPEETMSKIIRMLNEAEIEEIDIQKLVAVKGHYPESTPIDLYSEEFVNRWLFPNWERIVTTIHNSNS